jgi:hypothetical protein
MMELEKTKQQSRSKKQIDWKSLAIESGYFMAQGALVALGSALVNKSIQTLTSKKVMPVSSSENVLPIRKSVNG